MRPKFTPAIILALAIVSAASLSHAAPPVDPKTITTVDAGLGSCSADFTVTDEANAPLYNAQLRVHIAYGFMGFHKLDLQAGGKARFIGLPENPRQPLFFRASQGDKEGSAFDDPAQTCKTQFTIVLRKKPQT